MAYPNNYFPVGYQPYQIPQPQPQPQPPQQQSTGIIWCQGENAARSFIVNAGQSVMLMDSERSVFYIKSADQSGMPLPLRIFDYTERTAQKVEEPQIHTQPVQNPDYITREEFEQRLAELSAPKQRTSAVRKEKE